jgi:hypothetical protein
MSKLNWWRSQKLYGRRVIDHRFENELPDAAERWLRRAESGWQRERRSLTPSSSAIAMRSSR